MKTFFTIVIIGVVFALGCAGTHPVPTPPQPTPDAGPADVFEGIVVDCSQASSSAPIDQVRTCLDVANTAECLVGLFPANTLDTIACAVRGLSVSLHVQIARGAANEQMTGEARAADAWVRAKKIGYR